jgi:hypothetical protein
MNQFLKIDNLNSKSNFCLFYNTDMIQKIQNNFDKENNKIKNINNILDEINIRLIYQFFNSFNL